MLNKDLRYSNKPDHIIKLEITPYKHLYNRYIPCLLSTLCVYNTRIILKHLLRITNSTIWVKQNRIQLWAQRFKDICWTSTLNYLSFNEWPLSLHTNLLFSKLKNFKVKIIAGELPTHLILHQRNLSKYENYLYARCTSSPETIAHLLTCPYNSSSINRLLTDIISILATETKLSTTNLTNFISTFKYLHIQNEVLIGFITSTTLAPFERDHHWTEFALLLHHLIIWTIYEEIWLPLWQITHTSAFITPAPLSATTYFHTNPFPTLQIKSKTYQYISNGQLSID